MNIKITYHILPWEIDYALLTFTQLKKSKYHLPDDVNVTIDSVLNLSTSIINWEESKLPKEYFIKKYKTLSILLKDYTHHSKVYEGDELYGHLDLQRDAVSEETDYYLSICPDIYFSEHLLAYIAYAAKQVTNKYFLIIPQICKMWDTSWDEITHTAFTHVPHEVWEKHTDIFDVDYMLRNTEQQVQIAPVKYHKWAGWFDLYNKEYYEKLVRIPDEWRGYGGLDSFGMYIANYAKHIGLDFQQYQLEGQIAFEYSVGPLRENGVSGFTDYYKDLLCRKDSVAQREAFDAALPEFIQRRLEEIHKQ